LELQQKLALKVAASGDESTTRATMASLRKENLELKQKLSMKVALSVEKSPGETYVDTLSQHHLEQAPVAQLNRFESKPKMAKVPAETALEAGHEAEIVEVVIPSSAKADSPNRGTKQIREKQHDNVEETDRAETENPVADKLQRFLGASKQCVESPACEAMVGVLIIANTLVMMFETQYIGLLSAYQAGLPYVEEDPLDTWRGAKGVFLFLEQTFTVIFTLELLLRALALRCALFKEPLNWLDILAVAVSLLHWLLESIPVNPTILRLIRAARLIRGLRFMRLSKVLASLTILIKCIRASVNILFWSCSLLMMIQGMIAMLASQLAQQYIVEPSNPVDNKAELYMYFGSFTRAFISMFEIHMANWARPCRVLVETLGEVVGDLFIFYRCIIGFSLMNVIGAVFVQQTMSVVQNDNDVMILNKQKEAQSYETKLKAFFAALDEDQNGRLSRKEFDEVKTDEELNAWMSALDIDQDGLEGLFSLLDTGDDEVSMDEFVTGATRLRGPARSTDMAHVLTSMDRLGRQVTDLHRNVCAGGSTV